MTDRTETAHKAVLEQLKTLDYGRMFQPPSLKGTVTFPGLAGGAEWGGSAFDPETHLYYINANELPWLVRLVPAGQVANKLTAGKLYRYRCAGCHGPDKKGAPPEYPALDHLSDRLTSEQITSKIHNGGGRMPGFASLGDPAIQAITGFLTNGSDSAVILRKDASSVPALKYGVEGYRKFLDPDGYPANKPPWGTLSAIDLDGGGYCWKIPLGEYPELVAQGLTNTGSENHGGGIVTAGGLFFIGSTHYDNKFRAFDKKTGALLWETTLPNANNATPSTYEVNGRQYVVVAAGGGRDRPSGGSFIAFALPATR